MIKWKTLAKYLANEADTKEEEKIHKWIQKDKNNRKSFEEIKMHWNKIENSEESKIDTEKAWYNLKNRIVAEENISPATVKPITTLYKKTLRYAAIALLIIGLGTAAFFAYQEFYKARNTVTINTTSDIQNKKVLLPDGSVAFLKYNSTLNYPKQFIDNNRIVKVDGEVYFDVRANSSQPFTIIAKNAQIEVLGTSFNVNTNLPDNVVEVLVESGKVKLFRQSDQEHYMIIESGHKGIVNDNTLKKEKNTDLNYLAWKTGKLVFRGEKMKSVLKTLNKTYNVQIQLDDPEIKDYKITTHFNKEPIDTVLNVIATTFNLKVDKINNHEYVINNDSN